MQEKITALAKFLNVSESEILEVGKQDTTFAFYDAEFLVLDVDEADLAVKDELQAELEDSGVDSSKVDLDTMSADVIERHGRGAYLADDFEENSEGHYFIYRQN